MSVVEALVLGIVQGLTEFLPISSTAHLRAVPAFMGWADPGVAYSAFIQLGSIIAVVAYFWRDLLGITTGSLKALAARDFTSRDLRMGLAIVIGTIPICIIGLLAKGVLEQSDGPLRSLYVVGGASILMGILLLLAEKAASHKRDMQTIGLWDGLLVGLGQAMALIPGCSRSGSTLTVAMFLGLKRDEAARFSFLLGVPSITLAGLVEFKEMVDGHVHAGGTTELLVGLVASLFVSYASIAWLIKFLGSHSTGVFVAYRLVFGAALLILASTGLIR